MVRGVCKNVVIVKDTGSELFEQAILILKPAAMSSRYSEANIHEQAKRILEEYDGKRRAPAKEKKQREPSKSPKLNLKLTLIYTLITCAAVAASTLLAHFF